MSAGGDVLAGPTDDGPVFVDRAAGFNGRERKLVTGRNVIDQARHVRPRALTGIWRRASAALPSDRGT